MFSDQAMDDAVWRAIILTPLALLWVVSIVRLVGLRSFSKMAAFDFAVTVAIGSLLAAGTTASDWSAFINVVAAIAALLFVQYLIAFLRVRSQHFRNLLSNDPVLLMRNGEILHDNLKKTRVAEGDIIAKLREANALRLSDVHAVILETTGDISVLHGGDGYDDILLDCLE